MTPDQALSSYRRAFGVGETVTVRRYTAPTGSPRPKQEADVLGRITGYEPQEIVGSVQQGDRKVIVLVDPAAAVPAGKVALSTLLPLRKGDKLVVRGAELNVEAADDSTRRIAGTLVAIEVQARG